MHRIRIWETAYSTDNNWQSPANLIPKTTVIREFADWTQGRGHLFLIWGRDNYSNTIYNSCYFEAFSEIEVGEFQLTWPDPGAIMLHPNYWKYK
jgi:hypothetical protein